MICSKCVHQQHQQTRVRCTPTFYHSPIFDDHQYNRCVQCRCSATYHSTVFNQDQNKSNNCYKQSQKNSNSIKRNQIRTNTRKAAGQYGDSCKFQRQSNIHPCMHSDSNRLNARGITNHQLLWCNPDKQIQIMNSSSCYNHNLSRQRKLIQLSSCPFYTDDIDVRSTEIVKTKECCHNHNYNNHNHEEINDNDSLDQINQQNLQRNKQQTNNQITFGRQPQEQKIETEPKQQIQSVPSECNLKKSKKQQKIDLPKQIKKYRPNISGISDKKLNLMDKCKKTVKYNGNSATGHPTFWAVTKSKLK